MKLAISNIAWDSSENLAIYSLMKKYRIEGLEIAPTKFFPKDPYLQDKIILSNLKKEIEEKELKIASMQSILFGRNDLKLFEGLGKREELLDYLKKGVLFAKELGIKNIVFGNPKNRISTSDLDYEIALSFFDELGDFAYKNNVYIGIETNPEIYDCNFLTKTLDTIAFINKCSSEGIGLNLDIGAMLVNKENIDILEKISIDKISHVHISEPYLNKIDIANKEFHKSIFKYLKEKNYTNYISIEMKQQNNEDIEEILKYISKLSKEVENE